MAIFDISNGFLKFTVGSEWLKNLISVAPNETRPNIENVNNFDDGMVEN